MIQVIVCIGYKEGVMYMLVCGGENVMAHFSVSGGECGRRWRRRRKETRGRAKAQHTKREYTQLRYFSFNA